MIAQVTMLYGSQFQLFSISLFFLGAVIYMLRLRSCTDDGNGPDHIAKLSLSCRSGYPGCLVLTRLLSLVTWVFDTTCFNNIGGFRAHCIF